MLMLSFAACSAPASSDDSTASEAPAATEAPSEEPSEAPSEAPSEEPAEDLSWQTIEDKGSFVLGFDETFAPMGFKDESGEHVGFDIELAQEVASRLGLELQLQPIDWDSKELELANGNIDVIWNGLTITDERKEKMLFSAPYMDNRQIVIVAADSGIASIADLAGKSVAAQVESSAMKAIEAKPEVMDTFGELIESPDYVEALMELKQGSVDAVVIDEIMGRYYIAEDENSDFYAVLEDNFGEEQYGIAFRLGEQAFRDKVQETLNAIISDGKGAEISKKWFNEDILIAG
jgi:polar amino acid transport system substrate-binding protein